MKEFVCDTCKTPTVWPVDTTKAEPVLIEFPIIVSGSQIHYISFMSNEHDFCSQECMEKYFEPRARNEND